MANDFEITKVRLIIRQFLWETRKAVESAEAAQKWLIQFRNTLEYQELEENPDAYALAILAEARSFNNTKQRNQQMRWVRAALEKDGIKNPTEEQLEECWMELYGKNENKGDAGHRDAPDESATVSSFSGTPEALVNQKRTGTAVPELRRAAHSPAPVRTSGPMPEDRQAVIDFAVAEGLDVDDACECWYVTTAERDGNDADGNPVTNWKAFVRTWCNTRSKKRSA